MNVKGELTNIKPKGANTFPGSVVHNMKGTEKLFFQGMRIPTINAETFCSNFVHPFEGRE